MLSKDQQIHNWRLTMTTNVKHAALGTAGILASLLFLATTITGVQAYGAPSQPAAAQRA